MASDRRVTVEVSTEMTNILIPLISFPFGSGSPPVQRYTTAIVRKGLNQIQIDGEPYFDTGN